MMPTVAPSLSQTVNQDATTTKLSSSTNPSVFGQTVTFTATVSVSRCWHSDTGRHR